MILNCMHMIVIPIGLIKLMSQSGQICRTEVLKIPSRKRMTPLHILPANSRKNMTLNIRKK